MTHRTAGNLLQPGQAQSQTGANGRTTAYLNVTGLTPEQIEAASAQYRLDRMIHVHIKSTVVEPDAEDDPAPHGAGVSDAKGEITTAVRDTGDRLVYESADMPQSAPARHCQVAVKKESAVIANIIDLTEVMASSIHAKG